MRLKFGSSQGLRTSAGGGAMSGIGSDPSYNPNSGSSGGGDDISAQIGDVSKKAYSFFSSVWESTAKSVSDAHISEQVSTTWGSITDTARHTVADITHPGGQGSASQMEQPMSFRPREDPHPNPNIDISDGQGGGYYDSGQTKDDPLVAGWSALSTGAMGLWQR